MQSLASWVSAAAVAGFAALAPGAASAAAFDCVTLHATSVATITQTRTTSSMTPVNLPGSTLTVTHDGGCVRVQFSAQVRAKLPARLRVRLTLDGAVPSQVDFYTTGTAYDNRTATFVVGNLPAGPHTFRLQYWSIGGQPVSVAKGVVTAWYNAGVF